MLVNNTRRGTRIFQIPYTGLTVEKEMSKKNILWKSILICSIFVALTLPVAHADPVVTNVDKRSITLKTGNPVTVKIIGRDLNKVTGVAIYKSRKAINGVITAKFKKRGKQLNTRTNTQRKLELTLKKPDAKGVYTIKLMGGKRAAKLPLTVRISSTKVAKPKSAPAPITRNTTTDRAETVQPQRNTVARTQKAPTLKIEKIESTTTGYVIHGKGFGKSKSGLKVLEGRRSLFSQRIGSVTDAEITVHNKPAGSIGVSVKRGGEASNVLSFRYSAPRKQTTQKSVPETSRQIQRTTRTVKTPAQLVAEQRQRDAAAAVNREEQKQAALARARARDARVAGMNIGTRPETGIKKQPPLSKLQVARSVYFNKSKKLPKFSGKGIPTPTGRSPSSSSSEGDSSSGGGTMTAQNHTNEATSANDCATCHGPILSSTPFWDYQAIAGDTATHILKIPAPAAIRSEAGNVSSIRARFETSNPDVVNLVGDTYLSGGFWNQIVAVDSSGTAQVSGRIVMNLTDGFSWAMVAAFQTVNVAAAAGGGQNTGATEINSVSCSPSPVYMGNATVCTAYLNGPANGQHYINHEIAAHNGITQNSAYLSVGQTSFSFNVATITPPGSADPYNYLQTTRLHLTGNTPVTQVDVITNTVQVTRTPIGGTPGEGPVTFSTYLLEKSQSPKCANCHSFAPGSAKYNQHVPGRFTIPDGENIGEFVHDSDNCNGCHTTTAWAAGWRAPLPSMHWNSTTTNICEIIKANMVNNANAIEMHLTTGDPLVIWAVDQMNQSNVWTGKVNDWVGDGLECQ